MRDVMVLKRIVILVNIFICLSLPPAILRIDALITGHLYPLAYRIQAICLAIDMLTMSVAIAVTNPQVKRLIPLFSKHTLTRVITIHPQQELRNLPARQA